MTSVAELYALQERDAALDARRAALADIEARLGESAEVEEARRTLAERQEAFRAAEKRFREREFETDELRRKIQPLEQKLYGGTLRHPKELADLQQDVESLKRRRSELEDHALEAMEAYEQAQAAVQEAHRTLEALEAAWQAEQAELRRRRASLAHEVAGLEEDRARQAAKVDGSLLGLYDRLRRTRSGRAVVRVEGGACQGCRISLPMNLLHRARSGSEVIQCSSCERILYLG